MDRAEPMPGMKATVARWRPFQFQVVQLTHQNRPGQRWLLPMILNTPSTLHTARHIKVVASWRGFPSWTPVPSEDR
jgi:hypothetical protein